MVVFGSNLYESLSLDDSEKQPTCSTCQALSRSRTSSDTSRASSSIARWSIAFCALCTLVNALLVISPAFAVGPSQLSCRDPLASVKKADLVHLRRPSPYIGLENISRPNALIHRSIINYPQTIALVDSTSRAKIFDDDPLRFMTHTGTVSPEDRLVQVDKSVSTIVQFRAIDFGMENCQLKLRIPSNVFSNAESFVLSVHRLDATHKLDTKTLSYDTRPSRVSLVGNIQVADSAIDWHRNFTCAWDEVLTFEIGCFTEERAGFDAQRNRCALEWWQNKEGEEPENAIYIVQHSTI